MLLAHIDLHRPMQRFSIGKGLLCRRWVIASPWLLLPKGKRLATSLELFPQVCVQPEGRRRNSPASAFLLLLEVGQTVAEAADKGRSLLVGEGGVPLIGGGEGGELQVLAPLVGDSLLVGNRREERSRGRREPLHRAERQRFIIGVLKQKNLLN